MTTMRVIKVDGFYCVIQGRDFHFWAPSAPCLNGMGVDVNRNANPLTATSVAD